MYTKQLDLAQFAGHTPGPWEATRRDDAKGNWQDCIIEQAMNYGGLRVARVERVDSKGFTNARLIAAAPALLAECRRLQAENARLLDLLSDAEFLMRQAGKIPGPMQDSFNRSAQDARAALKGGE